MTNDTKNRLYNEEDLVMICIMQHKPGTNWKLILKYSGPYRIKKEKSFRSDGHSRI